MATNARHRRTRTAARSVLAALLLQEVAGGEANACAGMALSEESGAAWVTQAGPDGGDHRSTDPVHESRSDQEPAPESCGCTFPEPSESDRGPADCCMTALHCVSGVAAVHMVELLPDPVDRVRAAAGPKWSLYSVALPYPTPPPRA